MSGSEEVDTSVTFAEQTGASTNLLGTRLTSDTISESETADEQPAYSTTDQ